MDIYLFILVTASCIVFWFCLFVFVLGKVLTFLANTVFAFLGYPNIVQ